jgi:hypothetical protein
VEKANVPLKPEEETISYYNFLPVYEYHLDAPALTL